jgi:hypothetical protein
MGKIAIYEVIIDEGKEILHKAIDDTFESTEEAKKHLRFDGEDRKVYQILWLSSRVKCESQQTMRLTEVSEEVSNTKNKKKG